MDGPVTNPSILRCPVVRTSVAGPTPVIRTPSPVSRARNETPNAPSPSGRCSHGMSYAQLRSKYHTPSSPRTRRCQPLSIPPISSIRSLPHNRSPTPTHTHHGVSHTPVWRSSTRSCVPKLPLLLPTLPRGAHAPRAVTAPVPQGSREQPCRLPRQPLITRVHPYNSRPSALPTRTQILGLFMRIWSLHWSNPLFHRYSRFIDMCCEPGATYVRVRRKDSPRRTCFP